MNLEEMLERERGIKFTKQQSDAINTIDGPILLLAVAGAGKTSVLITRTANMILNHNIKPSEIYAMTFSSAAALGMNKKFELWFGDVVNEKVKFSTIHSFAYSIVRYYNKMNNKESVLIEDSSDKSFMIPALKNIFYKKHGRYPNDDELKSQIFSANKTVILKKIYQKINGEYPGEEALRKLFAAIGYAKNMAIEPYDFYKYDILKSVNNFKDIYKSYEKAKSDNSFIDFDDMLVECYEILKKNKDILNKCYSQYKYFEIDEAQDTSLIQYKIIDILCKNTRNLLLVGDDDQSIYGFRGAYPQALLDFKKNYSDGKILYMEENFRCGKSIVDMSGQFISSNKDRYPKKPYSSKRDISPINIKVVHDAKAQAQYVLSQIRGQKHEDYAVLYRNNISSIIFMDLLSRNNIEFYIKDYDTQFFTHPVTQDITTFMKLAQDPSNVELFEKIYYKMKAYLSRDVIFILKEDKRRINVFDKLIELQTLPQYIKDKLEKYKIVLKDLNTTSPKQAILDIKYLMDYQGYLDKISKNGDYSAQSVENILANLEYIAENTDDIRSFLNRLDELKTIGEQSRFNRDKHVITLGTIHSSKGLEYKNVFIIDMIDGEFPSVDSISNSGAGDYRLFEEEKRLAYVGFTRAIDSLTLLCPEFRGVKDIKPSRFTDTVNRIIHPEIVKKEKEEKEKIEKSKIDFKVKSLVEHKVFGSGIIESIKDGIIAVNFKKCGIKYLSLSVCEKTGVLHVNLEDSLTKNVS